MASFVHFPADGAPLIHALEGLFAVPISVAITDPTVERSSDFATETACLPPMRAGRRREFLAGRAALRITMAGLGKPPCAVPMNDDRTPALPEGITASLSHGGTLCIAVADQTERTAALGLDIEPLEQLDTRLWETVCTRSERAWLAKQPPTERGHWAKRIFCIKEAAYKCQYALSKALLDFEAFDVTFPQKDVFHATFRFPVGSFAVGDRICGRHITVDDHIIAAARIPA